MSIARGHGPRLPLAMHPLIRVLYLVLLALLLPRLPLADLSVLALGLGLAHVLATDGGLRRVLRGLWYLRWLLAAIAVLYVGFTPGDPLIGSLPAVSRDGVVEGVRRVLVLVDLIAAVYLLLEITPLEHLSAAIARLLGPLRLAGLPPERIGQRIALTLSAVPQLQEAVRAAQKLPQPWEQRVAGIVRAIEGGRLPSAAAPRQALPADPVPPLHWLYLPPAVALWWLWPT